MREQLLAIRFHHAVYVTPPAAPSTTNLVRRLWQYWRNVIHENDDLPNFVEAEDTPVRVHVVWQPWAGSDTPICQDGRSGGFTELLARAEVSHDALIDFPSEKACKASDDVPFRPSIRPASDDIVDRRLVIAHTDHDGSMEGGVRLSVAAPIEAVSTGGHSRGGGDGTRAAELGKGGFRANPLRVIPEDNEHRGGGVGANGEALPEGGRRLGGESGEV